MLKNLDIAMRFLPTVHQLAYYRSAPSGNRSIWPPKNGSFDDNVFLIEEREGKQKIIIDYLTLRTTGYQNNCSHSARMTSIDERMKCRLAEDGEGFRVARGTSTFNIPDIHIDVIEGEREPYYRPSEGKNRLLYAKRIWLPYVITMVFENNFRDGTCNVIRKSVAITPSQLIRSGFLTHRKSWMITSTAEHYGKPWPQLLKIAYLKRKGNGYSVDLSDTPHIYREYQYPEPVTYEETILSGEQVIEEVREDQLAYVMVRHTSVVTI